MANLRPWEADLRTLLRAFAACAKERVQLQELTTALKQHFPGTKLNGQQLYGLKLNKELVLFSHVFKLDRQWISRVREVSEEEIPAAVRQAGLSETTLLKSLVLQKEVGVGPLVEYSIPDNYQVIVAATPEVVDNWVSDLYAQRIKLVGFDTESPPVFRAGANSRVTLLQLASLQSCLLIHIPALGALPRSVITLMEDGTVAKAGFGVMEDFRLLKKQYDVNSKSGFDVSRVCRAMGVGGQLDGPLGVQTCTALLLAQYVEKSKSITCSNWANMPLSDRQIKYAAADAITSLNCAIQSLLLKPGVVVPGVCTVPTDHTLALGLGSSSLIVALASEVDKQELVVSLVKGDSQALQTRAFTSLQRVKLEREEYGLKLRRMLLCGDTGSAEALLSTLPGVVSYQSRYLTVTRLPVQLSV